MLYVHKILREYVQSVFEINEVTTPRVSCKVVSVSSIGIFKKKIFFLKPRFYRFIFRTLDQI